jgi:peptidoglycan/LPS O-acetylase OafA/YrhL
MSVATDRAETLVSAHTAKTGKGGGSVSRLPALTGLRFIAALLVVAYHFLTVPLPASHGPLRMAAWALRDIAGNGSNGVSFFFILSGFILTHNYVAASGLFRTSSARFWLARFARIYPILFLAMMLAFLPSLFGHWCTGISVYPVCSRPAPGINLLQDLSLTRNWPFWPASYGFNPPSWSLSVEAFFYLLFPLIGLALGRAGRRASAGVVIIAWLAIVALNLFVHAHPGSDGSIAFVPLFRLPEFVMGVAAARIYAATQPTRPWVPVLCSFAACALLLGVLATARWSTHTAAFVILDPLFLVVILSLSYGRGWLARGLSLPAVVLLGEASYSTYILHYPLWDWLANPLARHGWAHVLRSPAWFLVYLVALVALSLLSYRFVERPCRSWILGLARRRIPQNVPDPGQAAVTELVTG